MSLDNDQTLLGLYYDSTEPEILSTSYTHPPRAAELSVFRRRAQLYNIRRARCQAQWKLNTTAFILTAGTCDTRRFVDSILHQGYTAPYPLEILPAMAQTFEYLDTDRADKKERPWLHAYYAVIVATMYWSRGLYQINKPWLYSNQIFTLYAPDNETVLSIRSTLRADSLLYLVLAVQPALAVAGFLVTLWLRKMPIGEGFNVASILSGLEPAGLDLIHGAGLSGKLRAPVRHDAAPQIVDSVHADQGYPGHDAEKPRAVSRIRYHLSSDADSSVDGRAPLDRRRVYL